jgi:hypothetical protein
MPSSLPSRTNYHQMAGVASSLAQAALAAYGVLLIAVCAFLVIDGP